MNQCPPPAPLSQKSYWTGGSVSASFAVNRLEAAKVWPVAAKIVLLTGVVTGAVSVAVKGCDH